MAQPVQQLSLVAPAFKGLNTQDSPIDMDPTFALVADNCVVDENGRLGARKGQTLLSTDVTALGTGKLEALCRFSARSGNDYFFSAGDEKIFQGDAVLTDVTPTGLVITDNHWKIEPFNDKLFFFQKGHVPLVFDEATNVLQKVEDYHTTGTVAPEANDVIAAFGRLWAADVAGNRHTLYWSDTLIGETWSGHSSGSIDLTTVWPSGYDNIVALAAHNNYLVIFGEQSILIYEGAEDPSTMALADSIVNIGCVGRDTIKSIGTDLLFMSREGLRSLGRTIQEKSVAIGILSRNIRSELVTSLASVNAKDIQCTFIAEDSLYVVSFPNRQIAYAFDVRQPLEDGSFRVTRWTTISHNCYFSNGDGVTYIGSADGIGYYDSYYEKGASYSLYYQSPQMSFGDTSRLKMIKNISAIFIGGGVTPVILRWGYGFDGSFKSRTFNITSGASVGYFGESEFNVAEFSVGSTTDTFNAKGSGSGTIVNIALEAKISGVSLSIQGFNLQILLGKITNG